MPCKRKQKSKQPKHPKEHKKFNGKTFTYSGFTWSDKGKEKRRKWWNRLGFDTRFIPSKGYTVKPLPKSKFLVYIKLKKRK